MGGTLTAGAAVVALRALHIPLTRRVADASGVRDETWCAVCAREQSWPCATRRMLDKVLE